MRRANLGMQSGDVMVVAQKLVSKAEGAVIELSDVTPSPLASEWAARYGKDPTAVEVILRESRRIVRMDRGIIIAETRHGFVCANAGVDASNVPAGIRHDAAARSRRVGRADRRRPRREIRRAGRGDRRRHVRPSLARGTVNVALGVAGLQPLLDWRGGRIRTAACCSQRSSRSPTNLRAPPNL